MFQRFGQLYRLPGKNSHFPFGSRLYLRPSGIHLGSFSRRGSMQADLEMASSRYSSHTHTLLWWEGAGGEHMMLVWAVWLFCFICIVLLFCILKHFYLSIPVMYVACFKLILFTCLNEMGFRLAFKICPGTTDDK